MKIDRQAVFDMYSGHCAYCGCEIQINKFNVDHVVAKINWRDRDGVHVNELNNLKPSCKRCNSLKLWHSIEQFRYEISQQVSRGRKSSVNFRTAERYGLINVIDKPIVFYFEQAEASATK